MSGHVDYFVREIRDRMARDGYVKLGPVDDDGRVGLLTVPEAEAHFEAAGVTIRFENDHDDETGEKLLFCWVPEWARIAIRCLGLDYSTPEVLKNFADEDRRGALQTAFAAGGLKAARSYADSLGGM